VRLKLTLIVLLLMAGVLQLAAAPDKPSFILKDSGFPASSQHRIYWLDNERVIFTGYEIDLEKIDKQGKYGREQNIYIWDTRENRRSVYVKNASLGCYFRGYIRYSILEGPSKKGLMGQERIYLDLHYSKDTWEGEPPEWEDGVKTHPITCKSYRSRGMDFVPLLPEHGHLEFRRSVQSSENNPNYIVWHLNNDEAAGRVLPVLIGEVLGSQLLYIEFLNAYVMSAGIANGFWLLMPSGEVTKVILPDIKGGWRYFMPTRTGIFASGGTINVKRENDSGSRGAYWVEGNTVHKIVSGFVQAMKVSPDGCKVAFVREPHDNLATANRITLHLLNICPGE
jgi:hypothetical protein